MVLNNSIKIAGIFGQLQEEICKFVVQFNGMQIVQTPSPLLKLWEEREHDYTEMMKTVVDIARRDKDDAEDLGSSCLFSSW